MRLFSRLVAAALVAVSSVASAQPVAVAGPVSGSTVIDFNALADRTLLSNQFAGLGVTITSSCFITNGNLAPLLGGGMAASNFAPVDADCPGDPAAVQGQPVTFTFSSTMHYFGFLGVSKGSISLTDANGFISVPLVFPTPAFVGFTDVIGFNSVTISGQFGVDNVSFSPPTTTVPEPSSVALLAAGMLALAGVAGRKRRVV